MAGGGEWEVGNGKWPKRGQKMGAKRLPTRLIFKGSRAGRKINNNGRIMHRRKNGNFLMGFSSILI